ncbi:MAG: polysulfide reductase NrfD, partial [Anaerolineales bacterium]|nr:polysulfide reductase NrfD [Anaerolineales bacterium]
MFPDNSRHFQVTRCNHCANPPCVEICPVTAMFKRLDGIVDFDSDACIGCKACIQACPYDAIYIDPDSLTAAKCHYCAHRTEIGLEPACVVVCPEQAIISGDIDDPHSKIRQLIDNNQVKARKPEIGTKPKLFYIEGSSVTLDPIASTEIPSTYMWSDVEAENKHAGIDKNANKLTKASTADGPVKIGGKVAEHMVQVSYDVNHKKAWHWPVAAYLTTKAIAAGTYLMLMCAMAIGVADIGGVITRLMSLVVLVAMVATGIFLCVDLERPERFLRVIMRPQWRSWLSRGAWILVGFGGIVISIMGINLGVSLEIGFAAELENMLLRPTSLFVWGGV